MKEREVIGNPDCPIMYRRTLLDVGPFKLLHHEFVPGSDDKDPHDHPRSFVTFVYRGGYIDVTPCAHPRCLGGKLLPVHGNAGENAAIPPPRRLAECPTCGGMGELYEYVLSPALRFRRAEHAHITRSPQGAKSIVAMGPIRREWGFWRSGTWWPMRKYLDRFGQAFRCDD